MGGGLESSCVGHVYGVDDAVRLKTTTHQNLGAENHMPQFST